MPTVSRLEGSSVNGLPLPSLSALSVIDHFYLRLLDRSRGGNVPVRWYGVAQRLLPLTAAHACVHTGPLQKLWKRTCSLSNLMFGPLVRKLVLRNAY